MKRLTLLLALILLLAALPAAAETGIYAADIEVSDDALGLTDAVVMLTDAGVTVRVTATAGDGMPLYVGGTAVQPSVNAAGEYTYTLPIEALDVPTELLWHDAAGYAHTFTLTVCSEDMTPLGGAVEAEAETDPAALQDGSYAVADFSFSGGSGKVTITCEALRVEGGAAVARIVFSSPRYGYVKVDGVRYDGTYTEDTSAFDIPVRLGADTVILGMTTAMSQPHEIEYTLRVTPGERLTDEEG